MFGRVPRLPVDIIFGSALRNDDVQTYDEYVETLQEDMREAIRIAQGNTTGAQRRQAREYNKKSKGIDLEVGDRVLLVNKKEKGKRKLADVWDSVVHVVTWKDPTLHIYRVEDPTTRKSKVVHRNFLLPVNFLPLEEPEVESTVFSTISEGVLTETKEQGSRSLFSSERGSKSGRTAAWILQAQGPRSSQSVGTCTVQDQGTEQVTKIVDSAKTYHTRDDDPPNASSGSSPSELSSDCDTSNISVNDGSSASESFSARAAIDNENMSGGSVNNHRVQVSPDNRSDHCPRSQVLRKVSGSDTNPKSNDRIVRTRSGRVVKPVKRLLECMSMIISEPNQRDPLAELFFPVLWGVRLTGICSQFEK